MNRLSWLIYLADVSGNIGFPSALFTVIGTIAALISTIIKSGCAASEDKDSQEGFRIASSIQKASLPVAIIALVLAIFVPSKDTVYAIAASEMGEEVLKTPEAAKARQALNAWLDKQIDQKKQP